MENFNQPQLPILGLNLDVEPINQPDGSYRFALNAVHDSESGSQGSIVNEHSNQLCVTLDGNIVGQIPLDRYEIVYFTDNDSIYLVNTGSCEATLLKNVPGLGFNVSHPITGKHKVINGCERIIYWNNGVDKDRFFNLDKPSRFTLVDDFSLVPNITYPCMITSVLNSGGKLEYGAYQFVLEYLDNSLSVLYRTNPSDPIYIGENLNIDTFQAEVGGKNVSTQSIKIELSNIDDQAKYLRVGVIELTSGDGITRSARYIGQIYPSSVDTITYAGPTDSDILVDADQLRTSIVFYETSRVIETVHGRLLRGNLKEQSIDYSTYQAYASKIRTNYAINLIDKTDLKDQLTEQSDEVKAYSISYLHNTGKLSPPFHIPGRAYKTSDGSDYLRLNTADSSDLTLGFYACDSVYTNPSNYCGEDYWGLDADGNELLGTYIRHHRIPSRSIEPLIQDDKIAQIGITFSNIEYPDDSIIGHFFLSSELNDFNRTVQAAGYSIPYNYLGDSSGDKIEGRYINYLPNGHDKERQSNNNIQNFISLEYFYNQRPVNGEYLKITGYLNTDYDDNRPKYEKYFKNKNHLQLFGKHHSTTTFTSVNEEVIDITDSINLLYQSTYNDIPNRSLSSNFNLLTIENDPETFGIERANLNYGYIKSGISPHCNINGIRYRLMNTCPLTGSENTLYAGDSFISAIDITNISRITTEDDTHFGLLFIPIFGPSAFLAATLLDKDEIRVEYELISKLYFESPLNYNRRVQGTDECNKYYDATTEIDGFIMSRVSIKGTDEKVTFRDSICPEWYGYNPDYTRLHMKIFYPLTITYDYCSNCLNHYPTRITWSDVGTDEQSADSWRIFKPLNYTDLPAHRGELIGLDYHNGHLVCRATHSFFILQPDPQRLETDGTTIRLGTGEFLGVPPLEPNDSDLGSGGQQCVLSKVKFDGGLAWVDQDYGSIYIKSDRVEEISQYGMYHFFRRNLPSAMKEYLKDEFNPDHFPVIMTYDPTFDRLIIHKKDFYPLDTTLTFSNGIFYKGANAVSYNDPIYFENKSFTVSFSMKTKSWIGFHSYNPDHFSYTTEGIFSILNDSIYSHNNYSNFSTFFDIPFDFVIEITDKNLQTYNTHGVFYHAIGQEYDSVNKVWIDSLNKTFTHALVYTKTQSTGLFALRYSRGGEEDNIHWSNYEKPVTQTDRNYKIAQIRDLSTGQPVNTQSWEYRKSVFIDGQGYIDHTPYLSNISYTKEQYDLNEFRDKWVNTRLFFKENDSKLTVHLFELNRFVSNR